MPPPWGEDNGRRCEFGSKVNWQSRATRYVGRSPKKRRAAFYGPSLKSGAPPSTRGQMASHLDMLLTLELFPGLLDGTIFDADPVVLGAPPSLLLLIAHLSCCPGSRFCFATKVPVASAFQDTAPCPDGSLGVSSLSDRRTSIPYRWVGSQSIDLRPVALLTVTARWRIRVSRITGCRASGRPSVTGLWRD